MTKITIEQENAIATRIIHSEDDDEFETWPELLPAFFEMLVGLGYGLAIDPITIAKIVEDAHDAAIIKAASDNHKEAD